MGLLPIYITAETIENIQASFKKGDFLNMEYGRDAFEMIEFLKHGAFAHIDLHESEINLGELYKSNPLLAHLVAGGNGKRRVEYRPDEHQRILSEGLSQKNTHFSTQYFTSGLSEDDTRRLEQSSGMLHHSLKASIRTLGRLFRTHVEYFRRNRRASMDIIFEKLLPHHSIVIIDPYLLREDNEHLIKFFRNAIPRGIGIYHVTLILSTEIPRRIYAEPEKWIQESLKNLQEDICSRSGKTKIEFEFIVVNEKEFHDRMILTNNQVIFQGYGMETINKWGKGQKLTTWVYIPHTKMDARSNGNLSCHFKNIREITDAIHDWHSNAETYSTRVLMNPILQRSEKEVKRGSLQARGTSLETLYQKFKEK
jgi:hypothetical protein